MINSCSLNSHIYDHSDICEWCSNLRCNLNSEPSALFVRPTTQMYRSVGRIWPVYLCLRQRSLGEKKKKQQLSKHMFNMCDRPTFKGQLLLGWKSPPRRHPGKIKRNAFMTVLKRPERRRNSNVLSDLWSGSQQTQLFGSDIVTEHLGEFSVLTATQRWWIRKGRWHTDCRQRAPRLPPCVTFTSVVPIQFESIVPSQNLWWLRSKEKKRLRERTFKYGKIILAVFSKKRKVFCLHHF